MANSCPHCPHCVALEARANRGEAYQQATNLLKATGTEFRPPDILYVADFLVSGDPRDGDDDDD